MLALGLACVLSVSCDGAMSRKVYVDQANGVSFSYPAGWTLNGDDDAATAKLRVALSSSADAVVTLEGNFADAGPYKGTEFEAGAFAYAVRRSEGEQACFAALDGVAEGDQQAVHIFWNDLPARRLIAQNSIAGTVDAHRIIAAYGRGRCYLFETVLVSHAPEDAAHPLGGARWRLLREEFAGVLDSVRLSLRVKSASQP